MSTCLLVIRNDWLDKATRLRVDSPSQAVTRVGLVANDDMMFEVKDEIPRIPPSSLQYTLWSSGSLGIRPPPLIDWSPF